MGKTSDAHIANITRLLGQAKEQYDAVKAVQKDIRGLDPEFDKALHAKDSKRYEELLGKEEKMQELVQTKLRACLDLKNKTSAEIVKFNAFLTKKDKDTKLPWKKTSLKASKDFIDSAQTGLACMHIFGG
jgi:hypothetical protein